MTDSANLPSGCPRWGTLCGGNHQLGVQHTGEESFGPHHLSKHWTPYTLRPHLSEAVLEPSDQSQLAPAAPGQLSWVLISPGLALGLPVSTSCSRVPALISWACILTGFVRGNVEVGFSRHQTLETELNSSLTGLSMGLAVSRRLVLGHWESGPRQLSCSPGCSREQSGLFLPFQDATGPLTPAFVSPTMTHPSVERLPPARRESPGPPPSPGRPTPLLPSSGLLLSCSHTLPQFYKSSV